MNGTARHLAALFCAGLVLFLSPGVGAFRGMDTLFGFPPLPLLLFLVWGALVGVTCLVARRGRR